MKLLLSNDDGVLAPGIRALYQELSEPFDATIIAPLEERSTTGHSLSLDKPLRLERLEESIYGCSGFPGDCVLMGLGHVMKENRPDVVISGINRGANLGQDLYYSGTVAAAREAAFHSVPSIAVSLCFENVMDTHHYETAAKFIHRCLVNGLHKVIKPLTLININVPNRPFSEIKGVKLTTIGFRRYSEEIHARIDSRGRNYYWVAGIYEGNEKLNNSDCVCVDEGYIAITPHNLVAGSHMDEEELKGLTEKLNAEFHR
jgi:5'-nucleotidase